MSTAAQPAGAGPPRWGVVPSAVPAPPDVEIDGEAPFEAALVSEVPERLEVGRGTVVYLEGRCDARVEPGSVEVSLGAQRRPVDAELMPAEGEAGPGDRWWVLLELPAATPHGPHEIRLHARLGDRDVAAPLGSVEIVESALRAPLPPSVVATSGAPLIAVCMATWEPQPERLRIQLDSLRDQDWPEWVCVISDDASSPATRSQIVDAIGEDPRFLLSHSESRLGFYRNFERALRMAPVEASFIALCDQDDRWYPDKLSRLHATLSRRPRNLLAYSDMRITDADGAVISDTYWFLRDNRWDDLASLLIANTVTGAASLFHRGLLDDALPFPPPPPGAAAYHDHWLALCALAGGDLAYLDEPTYDRVRHETSVTAETRHARVLRLEQEGEPDPISASRPPLRDRIGAWGRGWRAAYFGRYLLLRQMALVLRLRIGPRLSAEKRAALERIADAERSAGAEAWLAVRSLRPWIGRDETMARERVLLAAVLWRRLARGRLPALAQARRRRAADAQTR